MFRRTVRSAAHALPETRGLTPPVGSSDRAAPSRDAVNGGWGAIRRLFHSLIP